MTPANRKLLHEIIDRAISEGAVLNVSIHDLALPHNLPVPVDTSELVTGTTAATHQLSGIATLIVFNTPEPGPSDYLIADSLMQRGL